MPRIYAYILIVFALAPLAHADTLVGVPIASGPGLGTSTFFPAPPAGTPTWFMGSLDISDNSWVDLDLSVIPTTGSQTISVLLSLTNSSGVNFDEFHFWLSGTASFSFDPGLPPTSLLPLGGAPVITEPKHLSFEPVAWLGNASTNTVSFNLVIGQQAPDESVSIRVGAVPEPASGVVLMMLSALALGRRRRHA